MIYTIFFFLSMMWGNADQVLRRSYAPIIILYLFGIGGGVEDSAVEAEQVTLPRQCGVGIYISI